LTKPLGFGVTTTALKREQALPADVQEVVGWMTRLNRAAARLATEFSLRCATDITGFSLLGHGLELARAGGVGFRLNYAAIPFVSCARRYAELWTFPGGAADNRLYFEADVRFAPGLDEAARMLLFDPQTSGGLLLAVPEASLPALLARAAQLEQPVWPIGEVVSGSGIEVV
jgi:selenide,water dikinase